MQKIRELMSREVEVISPEATIVEAAQRMREGNFGLLPVGKNDQMVGAISDRDIAVRAVALGKDASTKVREVMSEGIYWAYDDESVADASKIMSERQVRRLPIVNRDKRLVGILALGDIAARKGQLEPAAKALAEISEPA
jgi:CBS domain-containing protein